MTRTGGAPVARANIGAFDSNGMGVGGTQTAFDGSYFLPVTPGTYYVDARAGQDNCTLMDVSYDGQPGSFHFYWNQGRSGELQTVVVLPGQCASADFQMSDAGGGIEGRVTEDDGVTPIANVSVTLYDQTGAWVNGLMNSADGTFMFCGLAPGTYLMDAWPTGSECFIPATYAGLNGNIWQGDNLSQATPIVVPPSTVVSGKDFQLARGGSITGKVTETDGSTPIAYAWVNVYQSDGTHVAAVDSMEDGTYTFSCLAPGEYVLDAEGPDTGCYRARTYPDLPGVIDANDNLANATRVAVSAGGVTSGIGFTLPFGVTAAGKVTEADGITPVAEAQVRILRSDGTYLSETTTQPDGTYSLCARRGTGYYVLDATGPGGACYTAVTYNGLPGNIEYADNLTNATRVYIVAGSTVSGIDFHLPPGSTITGKVTEQDGATPVPKAMLNAYHPADGQWAGGTMTQTDGTYSLCLGPGEYILAAQGLQGTTCYATVTYDGLIGGIWSGNNRAQATRITLTPGATAPNKNFQLPRGGTITGNVTQQDGTTPVANAYVSFYAKAGNFAGSASSESNGTYSVCLPAGEYVAYACPSGAGPYQCETYNGLPGMPWCGGNCANATPITVTADAVVSSIDFALDPLPVLALTLRDPPQPSGTCWTAGSSLTVDWQTTATEGNVYLTLQQDGQYRCYSSSVPVSTGTYTWTLPVTIGDGAYTAQATLTSSCGGTASVTAAVAFCVSGSAAKPVVQITEPAAGAQLAAGSTQTLRWTATNPAGSVNVILQRQGAMTAACSLGSTAMAAGQMTWTVPPYLGDATDYTINLTSYDGSCLIVSAQSPPFAITGTLPTPTLQITRPLPGECVQAGSAQIIQWTVPAGAEGTATATLKQGTTMLCSIGSAAVSAGQMAWDVPLYLGDATDYVIDLTVTLATCGNAPHGVSQPFCITGSRQRPVLNLTAPQSGEVIAAGSTFDITWDVPPDPARYVMIMLGIPSGCGLYGAYSCGLAVVPIADGRYSWVVSRFFESRSDYAIGLCVFDQCGILGPSDCAQSDAFSITGGTPPTPTISVTAPSGNQTWYRGTRQCVTWSVSHPNPAALEGTKVRVVLAPHSGGAPQDLIVVGTVPILDGQLCFTITPDTPEATDYLVAVVLEGDLCTPAIATGSVAILHLPPDLDSDGDVDLADFLKFQDCFNGPNRPPKAACIAPGDADLDNDADVDLADFLKFQDCFNGPNRP
ncbi:MAG: Ser-Thr-rich GPI-anchored membrane family protein, partial [Phycisphaerae bacterium]